MEKEIRGEFEAYIRELTEGISKEIFLEELKSICDSYGRQLLRYEQLISQAETAAQRVEAFSNEKESDIRLLAADVSRELEQVRETSGQLTEDYMKIFQEFSERVNLLNQGERQALVQTLDEKIGEYEKALERGLDKEYERLFQQMLKDFAQICDLNDIQFKDFEELVKNSKETYAAFLGRQEEGLKRLQKVEGTVEEKLAAVEEKIGGIVRIQGEVFRQFSEKAAAFNTRERDSLKKELNELLCGYRGSFAEEIAVKYQYIAEQFRTDLESVYREYENQLAQYQTILQRVQQSQQDICRFTAQNVPALTRLHSAVEENLNALNQTVAGLNNNYRAVFDAFSERVNVLNEQERNQFLSAMRKSLVTELDVVQQNYEKLQQGWQTTAAGLLERLEKSAKEQLSAQQQLKNQLDIEQKERSKLYQELLRIRERLSTDEETFHFYVEEHEKEQERLFVQLQQSRQTAEKEQQELWQRMMSEWKVREGELAGRRDAASWRIFLTVSNLLLIFLLTVLIVLQKPWELLTSNELILVAVVFLVLVLLLAGRRAIAALMFGNKGAEKDDGQ